MVIGLDHLIQIQLLQNMLKGDGIKTFVIGFQGYNNKANYTNLAKAGGTKNPFLLMMKLLYFKN